MNSDELKKIFREQLVNEFIEQDINFDDDCADFIDDNFERVIDCIYSVLDKIEIHSTELFRHKIKEVSKNIEIVTMQSKKLSNAQKDLNENIRRFKNDYPEFTFEQL